MLTHRGNSHQTTSIRRWQRSLNSAQICSVIYNGFLGLNHKRFGDDMVKITGWWQMVQECLSCFMVTPSDVTRNPAILSLQALELCSTVGQLQWSLWKLFALRFSVLLNLSHYDLTCCHSDSDSDTPSWCDNGFQERQQKQLMIEHLQKILYFKRSSPWHYFVIVFSISSEKYIWHIFSDSLFLHSIWHSFLTFYSGILSGISSDILSGILSGIKADIFSGILSGIRSHILFGIYFDILSGIYSGIPSDIVF